MVTFVVKFLTFTFTLLTNYQKTQYTFSLTLSHYNQAKKMKITQILIFHYTFTSSFSFPTHIIFLAFIKPNRRTVGQLLTGKDATRKEKKLRKRGLVHGSGTVGRNIDGQWDGSDCDELGPDPITFHASLQNADFFVQRSKKTKTQRNRGKRRAPYCACETLPDKERKTAGSARQASVTPINPLRAHSGPRTSQPRSHT